MEGRVAADHDPPSVARRGVQGDAPAMAEIRAAQLKEDLLALAELGSDVASCVLAEVHPVTLRRIVLATRVDWLPAGLNVELAHAGHAVLGDARLQRWGRVSVRRSMKSSLLGPILRGTIGVFGLSPAAIFRAVPAAYNTAYRHCGEMVVSAAEERVRRVELRGLPPVLQDRCFLLAMAGALEGVFDACDHQGKARLVSTAVGDRVEFEATWLPRAPLPGRRDPAGRARPAPRRDPAP